MIYLKPNLDGTSTKSVPFFFSQNVVSYEIFWQTEDTWFRLSSSENLMFSKFSSLNVALIGRLKSNPISNDRFFHKILGQGWNEIEPKWLKIIGARPCRSRCISFNFCTSVFTLFCSLFISVWNFSFSDFISSTSISFSLIRSLFSAIKSEFLSESSP